VDLVISVGFLFLCSNSLLHLGNTLLKHPDGIAFVLVLVTTINIR
jgi:hypothetical protein